MILSVARSTGSKSPARPRPADELWGRLELLRSRKGDPSYETMAEGSGLPRSTLHYWFTKHVIPEWVPFVRLLKYFNQDPRRWKTLHTDARNKGSEPAGAETSRTTTGWHVRVRGPRL
jgi:hypothetical protein